MLPPARPDARPADHPVTGLPFTRRALMAATTVGALGLAVTGTLSGCSTPARRPVGYGPLRPDPDGLLSLPEGFRYRVVAHEGETRLESGEPSPSDPDGAAAFERPDGPGAVLISNHELNGDEPHPVPHVEGLVYDPAARGGTTTIEVDGDGKLVRQYVSLAGTHQNCAGGRTPWDTWLSGEETEDVLEEPHGYVFEVDPFDRDANRDPRPIKALGRFPHEAVVVDPEEQRLYLTEDAGDPNGLLYRWTPPADALPLGKGSLRALDDDAGTLEALRATADGRHVADLSLATEVGTTYDVGWVTVPDRDARETSVRRQFDDDQVTRGRKLEGMWWGDGGAYVVSSFAREGDGAAVPHDGQVWFLDPRAGTMTLRVRFAFIEEDERDPDSPDGPDNITVSPFGGLMIAEDGEGRPHLLGTSRGGEVFMMARCEVEVEDADSEFCGPVFSPDERILFANLQRPGYTFAIQGPFADQP